MGEIQVLKPRLPDTYQEVEYIETSGTQYIDTGKHYGDGISVYCKFAITAASNYGYIFGGQKPNANFALRLISNTKELQILHGQQIVSTGITVTPNAINECTVAGTAANPEWTINGNQVSVATATFGATPANTFLCAGTINGTDPVYLGKNRIYEYRVSLNGTTIQQLIPCYRKSDNAIGFYDLAAGENDKRFYTNDGTGDFAKGADKSVSGTWINLPAHQKTSTGWKNIPTHIMTATGWQGELTSQSPLEFRTTGQSLLDWRIDGASGGVGERTENLFDGEYTYGYIDPSARTFYIDGNPNKAAIIAISPNTDYVVKKFTESNRFIAIVTDTAPISGTVGTLVNSNNTATEFTFNSGANGNYLVCYVSQSSEAAEPHMTVTLGSTAPATYIPYGYKIPVTVGGVTTNLYTDHQLMDGDSLDFATDQTSIPITQGDNTLTVGTAVQPSEVFVKFEG